MLSNHRARELDHRRPRYEPELSRIIFPRIQLAFVECPSVSFLALGDRSLECRGEDKQRFEVCCFRGTIACRVADNHSKANESSSKRPSRHNYRSDDSAFGLICTCQLFPDVDKILGPVRETAPVPGILEVQLYGAIGLISSIRFWFL